MSKEAAAAKFSLYFLRLEKLVYYAHLFSVHMAVISSYINSYRAVLWAST